MGTHLYSLSARLKSYPTTKWYTLNDMELIVGDPCPNPISVIAPSQMVLDTY